MDVRGRDCCELRVNELVGPKKGARTSARRFVTGLSGRKCATTSRTRATSSIPVLTIAMRRSSSTFTPSSLRKASSFRRLGRGIDEDQDAAIFIPKIAQHFRLAIGEIVLRTGDHHDLDVSRNAGTSNRFSSLN
jgi:hypothetical protein